MKITIQIELSDRDYELVSRQACVGLPWAWNAHDRKRLSTGYLASHAEQAVRNEIDRLTEEGENSDETTEAIAES